MMMTTMPESVKNQRQQADLTPMADDIIKITNNLGSFEILRANILRFETGLIGFHDLRQFALANLPYETAGSFKVLQSIDTPELSFIVMPMAFESGHMDEADIKEILDAVKTPQEDLALLLIVTLRQSPDGLKMTANLRAPVVIDTKSKTGKQIILSNSKHSIQHELAAA